eukprot:TRINITY_DN627_c2_g1_i1.p1 TRINITY_DN627_c2_g1~~TRINITY_DN627_c2_g1_i1.p1  ORF type:complete len:222 (-),score=40.23 TRINITY_DN627_c2_g1_i1:530-1111(-)
MNQFVCLLLPIIATGQGVTDIISAIGGEGSLFSRAREIAYGDSDDGSASAGGLISAFLAGDGDSIFGANVGGISINRENSDAVVAGVNGVSGEAEDGVVGYGILAQLAALTDTAGVVTSQSATGIRGEGDGEVAAVDGQQGSVETATGSAGFLTAGQATSEGEDPAAYTTSSGLAAVSEDFSISSALISATSG